MRWTELGAFTPVMRTHDGLLKQENHRFDSDAQTLAHFTRFAEIHGALLPYWKALTAQAIGDGLPLIRHTALVDPDWPEALDAHSQWMIGDDLLFAPVVTQGADTVQVAFPEGLWVHLISGETQSGRQIVTVDAPLGAPAVFVRTGAMSDTVAAIRALLNPR